MALDGPWKQTQLRHPTLAVLLPLPEIHRPHKAQRAHLLRAQAPDPRGMYLIINRLLPKSLKAFTQAILGGYCVGGCSHILENLIETLLTFAHVYPSITVLSNGTLTDLYSYSQNRGPLLFDLFCLCSQVWHSVERGACCTSDTDVGT